MSKTEHQIRISDIREARRQARWRKVSNAAILFFIAASIALTIWLAWRVRRG